MSKIKQNLYLLIILIGMFAWFWNGFQLAKLMIKPQKIEETIVIKEPMQLDDPILFQQAVEQASEKYKIKKDLFYAIKDCEGGSLWAWNKTNDGGYFQLNWETAKQYGAKDLSDVIDPFKSADLVGKIIQKEGLKPWKKTENCIIQKLISVESLTEKGQKE